MATSPPEKTMRADARRNRDKLIAAAKDLFAETGTDVSLDAVARRAGVGPGTLYRHFPTRDALVEAAYRSEVAELSTAADDLLASRPGARRSASPPAPPTSPSPSGWTASSHTRRPSAGCARRCSRSSRPGRTS